MSKLRQIISSSPVFVAERQHHDVDDDPFRKQV
jgi:hypothetical protein